MKLNELIPKDIISDYKIGNVEVSANLFRYMHSEKNCVIAYKKNSLGIIVLFGGVKKNFGYIVLNKIEKAYFGGMGYKIARFYDMNILFKVLSSESSDKLVIVDKESWEDFKSEILVESL